MSKVATATAPADSQSTEIIGASAVMRRVANLARRFAPTRIPMLLVGPTGTGKELIARCIHVWSRVCGQLVDVNCGALPRDLVEAQLFGYRRGAFTGAVEDSVGLIEAADGGTLFLDELCSLAGEAQVKLLRVVETGEFRRLGETTKRRADFRLVAASQTLDGGKLGGSALRSDLLHRLAGVVIELPPLVERRDDIVPLAQHFAAEDGKTLSGEALDALLAHSWPGNVRELKTALQRAAWLCPGAVLERTIIAEAIALGSPGEGEVRARSSRANGNAATLAAIVDAAQARGWQAARIAEALGIDRATLYRRLGGLGVSLRQVREDALSPRQGARA